MFNGSIFYVLYSQILRFYLVRQNAFHVLFDDLEGLPSSGDVRKKSWCMHKLFKSLYRNGSANQPLSIGYAFCPVCVIFKALSHECRIGQRMRNEWSLTHEKRMTLTKEKNNTHKQRTWPNDERPFKESDVHIKGRQEVSFVPYVGIIPHRLTGPLSSPLWIHKQLPQENDNENWPLFDGCPITCLIKGLVTRVPHRPTHEKRIPFNDIKTNDVDKG